MNNCYWHFNHHLHSYDYGIIGGGFVGMYIALHIKQKSPKAKVLLVESQQHGAMASSRNAGFACIGSVTELISDTEQYGLDKVIDLVEMRYAGLKYIEQKYGQAISFDWCGGYELFKEKSIREEAIAHIELYNDALQRAIGIRPYSEVAASRFRLDPVAIFNKVEGHIDTGTYFRLLRRECITHGVTIETGRTVTDIVESSVGVELEVRDIGAKITVKSLINCTNSLNQKWLSRDKGVLKTVRNQVLVTQKFSRPFIRGAYHMDQGYIYFRDLDDRILIGGARHVFPEEETDQLGMNVDNLLYLKNILEEYILPQGVQCEIDYAWSGLLSGGTTRLPIVERVSEHQVVALRLGGMGVAIAPIIANRVLGLLEGI